MSAASASRGSRWFVAAGAGYLVAFQAAALGGFSRTVLAVLGVHGFVVHVLLGKANALVPTYFDRGLAFPRAAFVALPLTTLGAAALAAGVAGFADVASVGAALWAAGVAVSLAVLVWTIRGNLSGAATATGEHNAHRRAVDRAANAAVPVALAYLAAGTYETVAAVTSLPTLAAAGLPGAVHLVAAGGALVLLFAVGFRLLPRFLVATPPRVLVAVVLPTGALAPAILVAGFGGGPLFHAGAALEAVAVTGFALAYAALYARSDRSRVGFHGVLAGVLSGVCGVLLGFAFATGMVAPTADRVLAHLRLNVLGLLGFAIVGVSYQFYPPTVGAFPGSDDRTALASILLLAGGLWLEAAGRLAGDGAVARVGVALGLVGALAYAYLVASAFRARATK